jgi:hypothetical protein
MNLWICDAGFDVMILFRTAAKCYPEKSCDTILKYICFEREGSESSYDLCVTLGVDQMSLNRNFAGPWAHIYDALGNLTK